MIYYLLGNIKPDPESGGYSKPLTALLMRYGNNWYSTYSCREVLNRGVQSNTCNLLVAGETLEQNKLFNANEIVCNVENLQRLLQDIVNTNVSNPPTITVGNRFIYWEPATTMRSPIGSLLSGILKLAIKYKCLSEDYETFKLELMKSAITAGSYLSDSSTNASLAIAIKLFSEYLMPDDPYAGYGAMGTNHYLSGIKHYNKVSFQNNRKELYSYFIKQLGTSLHTIGGLFKEET